MISKFGIVGYPDVLLTYLFLYDRIWNTIDCHSDWQLLWSCGMFFSLPCTSWLVTAGPYPYGPLYGLISSVENKIVIRSKNLHTAHSQLNSACTQLSEKTKNALVLRAEKTRRKRRIVKQFFRWVFIKILYSLFSDRIWQNYTLKLEKKKKNRYRPSKVWYEISVIPVARNPRNSNDYRDP